MHRIWFALCLLLLDATLFCQKTTPADTSITSVKKSPAKSELVAHPSAAITNDGTGKSKPDWSKTQSQAPAPATKPWGNYRIYALWVALILSTLATGSSVLSAFKAATIIPPYADKFRQIARILDGIADQVSVTASAASKGLQKFQTRGDLSDLTATSVAFDNLAARSRKVRDQLSDGGLIDFSDEETKGGNMGVMLYVNVTLVFLATVAQFVALFLE